MVTGAVAGCALSEEGSELAQLEIKKSKAAISG
jgi:hypothetical protein